jgi:hypothetical protein
MKSQGQTKDQSDCPAQPKAHYKIRHEVTHRRSVERVRAGCENLSDNSHFRFPVQITTPGLAAAWFGSATVAAVAYRTCIPNGASLPAVYSYSDFEHRYLRIVCGSRSIDTTGVPVPLPTTRTIGILGTE